MLSSFIFWSKGRNIFYRIKCFLFKRYTTVKSRHLDHTYTDPCVILPFTMFEILEQFVEDDVKYGIADWYYPDNLKEVMFRGKKENARDVMDDLVYWWNNFYLKWWDQKLPEQIACWEIIHNCGTQDYFRPWNDSPKLVEWVKDYKSKELENLERRMFDDLWKLDEKIDKELIANMKTIVELTPYLWL